jgi:hypothetical protein
MGNCPGANLTKICHKEYSNRPDFFEMHSEVKTNSQFSKLIFILVPVRATARTNKVNKIQGLIRGFISRQKFRIKCRKIKKNGEKSLNTQKVKYENCLIENNNIFTGEIFKGNKQGLGQIIFNQGSIYIGTFNKDKANGYGKLIHKDGDVYYGMWADDKAKGVGKYINEIKKSSYCGYWLADRQHGYGIEICKGSTFEGIFKNGKKEGIGKLTFQDGAYYIGEFYSNNICGIGTFYFKDNRIYQGEWKENRMNGSGILTWPNGNIFYGNFVQDKKDGFGVYYAYNKIYIANWKNSKMQGTVYLVEKGLFKVTIWEDGKRLVNLDKEIEYNPYLIDLLKDENLRICNTTSI